MPLIEFTYRKYKRDSKGRFVKGSHKKIKLPSFFRYTLAIKNLHGTGDILEDVSKFDAIITVIKTANRIENYATKNANKIKKKLRRILHEQLDQILDHWNATGKTIEAYEVEQIGKNELFGARLNYAYARIIIHGKELTIGGQPLTKDTKGKLPHHKTK